MPHILKIFWKAFSHLEEITFLVISSHGNIFHKQRWYYGIIQNVFIRIKLPVVLSFRLYTLRTFLLELRFNKPGFSN